MSKKLILTLFAILALAVTTQAQSPNAFNYQALVRDAAGQVLPNTQVSFRIILSDPASPAAPACTEIHQVTTDAFGRVALQIGQGKPENGLFSALDWARAQYAIQVELDVRGGSDFVTLGSSQLLSVPYALHARTVENDQVEDSDADPKNELQHLELAGDTLHISDGNYVVLSPGTGGNPESWQTLGLANDSLSLSGGNAVAIGEYVTERVKEDIKEGNLKFTASYESESQDVYQGSSEAAGLNLNHWQSFTPTVSGNLSAVEVLLIGQIPTEVTLSVYSGQGTGGTQLYSGTVSVNAGASFYRLDLSSAVSLAANSLYSFRVQGSSGSVALSSSNPYAGGRSSTGANDDLVFATFMETQNAATLAAIQADSALGGVMLAGQSLFAGVNGKVGIGTTSPDEALHVEGQIRMADGSQQNGYIMISDADGTASWANPNALGIGEQTLGLTNDTLSISDGNGLYMEDYLVDEMNQAIEEGKLKVSHAESVLDIYHNQNNFPAISSSVWQSFTPTNSGSLESIEVDFFSNPVFGMAVPSTINVDLYEGEGTGGTLLYSSQVQVTSGNHWDSMADAGWPVLTADSQYTFRLSNTFNFGLIIDTTGSYGGGQCAFGSNYDLRFAVYLEEYLTVPAIKTDSGTGLLSLYNAALNIGSDGKVGIGTTDPQEVLHVEGSIRMTDGSEQSGYVMTADGNGTASWSDPALINTDDQALSLSGATLSITDGNSVNLSNIEDSDFTLSHANAGSNTKVLTIEGKRDNGGSFGAYAEIQFKNTDGNSGGSGTPYVGAKISSANTDGSDDGGLSFYTYNGSLTQHMVITNDGEFGFGTDDPDYSFDVVQDVENDFVARIHNTANSNGSPDNGLLIHAGHNSYNSTKQSSFIMFETPNGTYCGSIKQNSGSSVNYSSASDRRLKENIRDTRYGLQDLLKIRVRDYNYIADGPGQPRTGFIAQELYEVYPTAVDKGGEDVKTEPWSVAYGKLTPVLVQAVQDQQELIEAQASRIGDLEAELALLREVAAKVEGMEARLRTVENAPDGGQAEKSQAMR